MALNTQTRIDPELPFIFGGAACPAHRDLTSLRNEWRKSATTDEALHGDFDALFIFDPAEQRFVPRRLAAFATPDRKNFEVNTLDLLLMDDNYDEVIRRSDKALEVNPQDTSAMIYKAIALSSSGRTEESLALYNEVLAIEPDNSSALHNMGLDLQTMGRYGEALACVEKTICLDGSFMPAFTHKAELLLSLGRHEEALDVYEYALTHSDETLYLTDTALYTAHRMGHDTVNEALAFVRERKAALSAPKLIH